MNSENKTNPKIERTIVPFVLYVIRVEYNVRIKIIRWPMSTKLKWHCK